MGKINLSAIIKAVAEENNISLSKADMFVHAFWDTIEEGLRKDGVVKVTGFGTFKLTEMKERSSVDVNTGERTIVPSYMKTSFVADKECDDYIKLHSEIDVPATKESTTKTTSKKTVKSKKREPAVVDAIQSSSDKSSLFTEDKQSAVSSSKNLSGNEPVEKDVELPTIGTSETESENETEIEARKLQTDETENNAHDDSVADLGVAALAAPILTDVDIHENDDAKNLPDKEETADEPVGETVENEPNKRVAETYNFNKEKDDIFSGIDDIISTPESIDEIEETATQPVTDVAAGDENKQLDASTEEPKLNRSKETASDGITDLEPEIIPVEAAVVTAVKDEMNADEDTDKDSADDKTEDVTKEITPEHSENVIDEESADSFADMDKQEGDIVPQSSDVSDESMLKHDSDDEEPLKDITKLSSEPSNDDTTKVPAVDENKRKEAVDETKKITSESYKEEHNSKTLRNVIIGLLALLALLFIGYLIYNSSHKDSNTKDAEEVEQTENVQTVEPVVNDSIETTEQPAKEEKSSAKPETYTLKRGESLTDVSLMFYGTKDSAYAIGRYNNLKNMDNVYVGTELKLP